MFIMLIPTTGEERIPFNEGYRRSNVTITLEDLGQIAAEITAAS